MSTKSCPGCKKEISVEKFTTRSGKIESRCAECRSAYQREYRSRPGMRDKYLAYFKEYGSDPEYKEHRKRLDARPEVVQRKKDWFKNNPEKAREYNRIYYHAHPERQEYLKNYAKRYGKTDLEKSRWVAKSHEKRQFKKSIGEKVTKDLIVRVKVRFENRCFRCGSSSKLNVDHHMPCSKGNPLTDKNAVLLCFKCNRAKGTKLPQEFYTSQELQSIEAILQAV